MSDIKTLIGDATKDAMRARDKERVAALRMVNAELKRVEVDERKELSDADVLGILNKMLKQRRDSLGQFESAGRMDLADKERFEIGVIEGFMPQGLSEAEITDLVAKVIEETGAASMKDMGQVMGQVKARAEGRADMAVVSAMVKSQLS